MISSALYLFPDINNLLQCSHFTISKWLRPKGSGHSRIARDIRGHLDLRDAISATGATLESPTIEFGEDSDSVLVENLLASVSQHQRQKGAEQTKNRMRARMMNGYWTFSAPFPGYKMKLIPGRGKMLIRSEPVASIIVEGFEGMASGRFQTQAEVKRFFESQPEFPKNRFGKVTNEDTNRILTRLVYAGMIERPEWNITLREGQHEGLVSYETFLKVQERLKDGGYVPMRANINREFPLRGFVACGDCGHQMTSCWSTGRGGVKHPYYMCFQKSCGSYRKSIRRDQIEGEFADILKDLTPANELLSFAKLMFRDIWEQLGAQVDHNRDRIKASIKVTQTKIDQLVERLVDATNPNVIAAYEKKLNDLESDKMLKAEKLQNAALQKPTFEQAFEPAMRFLSNPHKLWKTGRFEYQQTVLKLVFCDRLRYCRSEGFRTAQLSVPFRFLGDFRAKKRTFGADAPSTESAR